MNEKVVKFEEEYRGILITKGMTPSIPAGGLTFSLDGLDVCTIHVAYDFTWSWVEIALAHLKNSRKFNDKMVKFSELRDGKKLIEALERDYSEGMQALMAAAIAVDAFYANVKDRIEIDKSIINIWKDNRTARYKQVSEVFRLAFDIDEHLSEIIRDSLKILFDLRDEAVHPKGSAIEPVRHPKIPYGVEPRFVSFGFQTAINAVRTGLIIKWELIFKPKPKFPKLVQYCDSQRKILKPYILKWQTDFEPLIKRPDSTHNEDLYD